MKTCKKCGNEVLGDDIVFCSKCETKILTHKATSPVKRKKFVILSSVGMGVLIVIGVTLLLLNTPSAKFKNAVLANQYSDAITVYNQKIKGNSEKEKEAESFINEELNTINQDFKTNKIDYQKATTALDTIKKLELLKADVEAAVNNINKLNDSRTSFKKGQEFIANKNLKDGISELKKVVTDDENYAKAQELISTNTLEYKAASLQEAEQLSSNTDYEKAVGILSDTLVLLPNDSDISAKKASYEKLNEEKKAMERKKKMEETKASQEVVVEKAGIIVQDSRYKALYPDILQVIVRNNSDKTVKNMKVSFLGYDTNGLPIKIKSQFSFTDAPFEYVGNAENVNIVSKATFGEDKGWRLDESHGIKTVISCVKEVEYYDGTKWTNPYYEYWVDEYKEKPLH